jgi:hypothetical protein
MDSLQETSNTEISDETNESVTTVTKQKGIGLGDSHVSLKYQLIPEKEKKFSLTGRLKVILPTGRKNPQNIKSESQYDLPVGNGTYALGLNISARKIAYPFSFSGYLAYTFNFTGKKILSIPDLTERKFRFGNLFETGLNGNLHLNEWIVFGSEINFYHKEQGEIENQPSTLMAESWALSYEPGLVFQIQRFRLGESVRIPVIGKNVPADPLYMVFAQYIF